MKILLIVFLIVFLILWLGGMALGIFLERKDWNKGRCPECGKEWRHFDNDSQGGRGYICDDCIKVIWISYPLIDRKKEESDE